MAQAGLAGREYCSAAVWCTIRKGRSGRPGRTDASFLNMVQVCAENGDPRIYNPPAGLPSVSSTPGPNGSGATSSPAGQSTGTLPSLNLRAGGYELSVGGSGGSGLFRTNQEAGANVQLGGQAAQVAEGIRDGAGRLWGNVRQKVEERVSRTGTPQNGR